MEKDDNVYWPAVLSFILPGLGQVAKKKLGRGYVFAIAYFVLLFLFWQELLSASISNEISDWTLPLSFIILVLQIASVIDTIKEIKFE